MSQKEEEYTPDFEDDQSISTAASADTSQFIHSDEIELELDVEDPTEKDEGVESESISAVGALLKDGEANTLGESQDFNQTKSESQERNDDVESETSDVQSKSTADALLAITKFIGKKTNDDLTGGVHELQEIENIMRKLEKLEKAQSALETTLNFDWDHNDQPNVEPVKPSGSKAVNIENIDEENEISEALSVQLNSVEAILQQESLLSHSVSETNEITNSRPDSATVSSDRSVEEVLREYDIIEKSVSENLNDDIFKPTVGPIFVRESSDPTVIPIQTSKSSVDNKNVMTTELSVTNKNKALPKQRPKSAGKSQVIPLTRTDMDELINSEMKTQGVTEKLTYADVSSMELVNSRNSKQPRYSSSSISALQTLRPKSNLSSSRNERLKSSRINSNQQTQPHIIGAGAGSTTLNTLINSTSEAAGDGINVYMIEKMKSEILRQETLINSLELDNQKLYSQLIANQDVWSKREATLKDEVNELKTEIATLKVSQLVPTSKAKSPNSDAAHKAELGKLKEESIQKSQIILELRRDILQRNNVVSRPTSSKSDKALQQSLEKETEYQKTIRSLNKQVRTLQKILYSKDPSAAAAVSGLARIESKCELMDDIKSTKGNPQMLLLENRIVELEHELSKTDSEAKERLKDFQQKLQGLKSKHENRIKELEQKLIEANKNLNSVSERKWNSPSTEELQGRLEKSHTEINHLKLEISRLKREQEIAAKSSTSVHSSAAKQDAGTLSLAIKSFKSELSEKERDILRMKKEIAELKKTNNNLKREREKYLSTANLNVHSNTFQTANLKLSRAKTDLGDRRGVKGKDDLPSRKPSSAPKANLGTTHLLEATLENERSEFEKIIEEKDHQIAEKEKLIKDLQLKITSRLDELSGNEKNIDNNLLDELRERLVAQNEVIISMRNHVNQANIIGEQMNQLKVENNDLRYRIQDLLKRCAAAESLSKPENEVLTILSQKVDELSSKYFYREKQLDLLLSRLSLRTGSSTTSAMLSPRLTMLNGSAGNHFTRKSNIDLDPDLRQISPSAAYSFDPCVKF